DGIRDKLVTGVQTCALPIFRPHVLEQVRVPARSKAAGPHLPQILAPSFPRVVSIGVREHQAASVPQAEPQAPTRRKTPYSVTARSEERRVGKECRARWTRGQ